MGAAAFAPLESRAPRTITMPNGKAALGALNITTPRIARAATNRTPRGSPAGLPVVGAVAIGVYRVNDSPRQGAGHERINDAGMTRQPVRQQPHQQGHNVSLNALEYAHCGYLLTTSCRLMPRMNALVKV